MNKPEEQHIEINAELLARMEARANDLGFECVEDYVRALLELDKRLEKEDPNHRQTHAKIRSLLDGSKADSRN